MFDQTQKSNAAFDHARLLENLARADAERLSVLAQSLLPGRADPRPVLLRRRSRPSGLPSLGVAPIDLEITLTGKEGSQDVAV